MSHGIQEFDKGIVWGDTWHKIESYVRLDRAVTITEAKKVLQYPLELRNLGVLMSDTYKPLEGFFAIVRCDHNVPLGKPVGSKFNILNNDLLMQWVDETLLVEFPQLAIESVGTLFNGQTAFINLVISKTHIDGDHSVTLNRLMIVNPLTTGSYRVCAHRIRVVCNNTMRMAEDSSNAILKVAHTASAGDKIVANLTERVTDWETQLTQVPATGKREALHDAFKAIMIPANEGESKREKTMIQKVDDLLSTCLLNTNDSMEFAIANSGYSYWQAGLAAIDKGTSDQKRIDWASHHMDGLIGQRANKKDDWMNVIADTFDVPLVG